MTVHRTFSGHMKPTRSAVVPRDVAVYCRAYGRSRMPDNKRMLVTGRDAEVTCKSCLRSMRSVPRSLAGCVVETAYY